MLKPTKYTNLELCLVNISATIVKVIQQNQIVGYEELLSKLVITFGDDMKLHFVPSINFLFLLGKIKYHDKIDAFELIRE